MSASVQLNSACVQHMQGDLEGQGGGKANSALNAYLQD